MKYVAVITFPQERAGSPCNISYAFTGEDQDEVIRRALAYKRSNPTLAANTIFVGSLVQEAVAPELLYSLREIKK